MKKKTRGSLFFKILEGVLIIVGLSNLLFAYLVYSGYEEILRQIRDFLPKELFQTVETNIYNSWLIGLSSFVVIVVFVLLFTILFTKKLLGPLKQLLLAAQEVGRGNLDVNVKIKTNDELEDLANEFNLMVKKLREARETLEDEKAVLEIRVKARTRELEELAQTLDEKVKERTKELQKRIDELERFHRLTVGREMKMIELKKRIKELEKELNKYKKHGKS